MGWTPLFLDMKDRHVLVVGAGEVGERRARRFLEAESQVMVTGGTVSEDLKTEGAQEKPLNHLEKLVEWADLVVVASGDQKLNQKIAGMASEKLLNRADRPENGNVIVPSSFFIGDVQICISTQGKSPLMSRQLRKKIQKVIKPEDVLQLELQHFTREMLKSQLDNQKEAEISQMEELTHLIDKIFHDINNDHSIREYLQIKTCNRAEMYLVLDKYDLDYHWDGLVVEKDEEALEHVLRLASGLESMIIGEDQILGQLKDAQKQAINEGCCGPVLNNVFTKAIHVGQIVRKKTHINEGAVSIGSAAVRLAEHVHGDLKCKKVLVIGAGQMGTLVAKALVAKKLKAIVVANRTHDRALCLAKELGGSAIHFDRLSEALHDADVVISATGAPHPIITYEKVKEAVPAETLRNMVMVDIANPRDIDERISELGVRLYNIDDLRGIARRNREMREEEAKAAEIIIEEELQLLRRSLKRR